MKPVFGNQPGYSAARKYYQIKIRIIGLPRNVQDAVDIVDISDYKNTATKNPSLE
jgi:hypothetical protein